MYCYKDIEMWMSINFLKPNFNSSKTIKPRTGTGMSTLPNLLVQHNDNNLPSPKLYVKTLSVYFDNNLSMDKHVSELTGVCAICISIAYDRFVMCLQLNYNYSTVNSISGDHLKNRCFSQITNQIISDVIWNF